MRIISDYEEKYVDKADLSNEYEQKYQVRYRQQVVNEQLEKYLPNTVLEVGCGLDSQYFHLKKLPLQYVIVEPGEHFYRSVRSRISDASVIMYNEMIENCIDELKDNKFDFIIVGSLLHEIEDVEHFFSVLKEIAGRDTVVHINVPNANSFHRLLAVESGLIENAKIMSQRNISMQQNHIWNMEDLCHIILQNGGTVLDKGSYAFKPFTHEQMMKLVVDNIITEQVLDGFNKCTSYFQEYGSEIYVNFKFG